MPDSAARAAEVAAPTVARAVARVVDYAEVLDAAGAVGLRCVYPNGAAFAPAEGEWAVAGWVTGGDATIRPAFRDRASLVGAADLSRLVAAACDREAWVAPVHHWAAELDHGEDPAAMAAALGSVGVDASRLRGRRRADAVALPPAGVGPFVDRLFDAMGKSDFALLLPGRAVLATLHHHRQVWWRAADAAGLPTTPPPAPPATPSGGRPVG